MTPMVPMPFRPAGASHGVGGRSPSTGGSLAGEDESSDPSAGELLQLGGDVLSTATLGIDQVANSLVEVACGHRQITVPVPPCDEQLDGGLPAPVPLLGFADPFDRIPAAKGGGTWPPRCAVACRPLRVWRRRRSPLNRKREQELAQAE